MILYGACVVELQICCFLIRTTIIMMTNQLALAVSFSMRQNLWIVGEVM